MTWFLFIVLKLSVMLFFLNAGFNELGWRMIVQKN